MRVAGAGDVTTDDDDDGGGGGGGRDMVEVNFFPLFGGGLVWLDAKSGGLSFDTRGGAMHKLCSQPNNFWDF